MKILATTPTNDRERLRRAVALIIDDAILFSHVNERGRPLYTLGLPTWDVLVERIAERVEQIQLERVQAFLEEEQKRAAYDKALEIADAHTEDERAEFLNKPV